MKFISALLMISVLAVFLDKSASQGNLTTMHNMHNMPNMTNMTTMTMTKQTSPSSASSLFQQINAFNLPFALLFNCFLYMLFY